MVRSGLLFWATLYKKTGESTRQTDYNAALKFQIL